MTIREFRCAVARVLASASCLALVAVPNLALAQIMTPSIPVPGEEPENSWAQLSYSHLFKADIEDLGDVQVQRESALLIVGRRFGEPESKFHFAAQFTYQFSGYNFFNDTLGALGNKLNQPKNGLQCGPATAGCGGNLWSDIHQYTFLGLATYKLEDGWTLMGGALLRLSGESGADWSQATNAGALVGFTYKWTENLNVGMIIGALTEIEGDATIVPLPIVNWRFAEGWKFALGMNQLGGVGYGPKVAYAPSKEWDVGLIGSYETRRYRLADDGSTKNFVGEENSFPVVFQVGWHPTPAIDLGAFAGMVLAGNLRMENQNGNRVFDKSYQPTPTAGLNGTIRF